MSTEYREPGRDGSTGIVSSQRAIRAREVSRPRPEDIDAAKAVLDDLVARARGQRRP
ncbi:MAG: hypothetical protein ACRDAX_06685 [Propionibacteriaceae bacterium]